MPYANLETGSQINSGPSETEGESESGDKWSPKMGDSQPASTYYSAFEAPSIAITLRAKKRALVDRISSNGISPKSRGGRSPAGPPNKSRKRPFGAQPPPPDDITNEDSSLLELFQSAKRPNNSLSLSPASTSISSSSSSGPSPSSTNPGFTNQLLHSPKVQKTPPISYLDFIQTPPQLPPVPAVLRKRQQLTPAPLSSKAQNPFQLGGAPRSVSRVNLKDRFADEADCASSQISDEWSPLLCLDWSLKTKLSIQSSSPFGFHSAGLKSSEESSGTSAFARCIDIDPCKPRGRRGKGGGDDDSQMGSQLDTSLGAQFHQTCLYWSHPTLPGVELFPREQQSTSFSFTTSSSSGGGGSNGNSSTPLGGIRMEQKVLESMFSEWVDAFRSVFQLLRTRQCPYFYLVTNQFTCLFSAAGTQGLDYLQAYVTPSTKGFRDALSNEGIEFNTPCFSSSTASSGESAGGYNDDYSMKGKRSCAEKLLDNESDDDEEAPNKWLDEMGISQDVSLSHKQKSSPGTTADEKNKTSLVVIAGTNTLAFFNLLINSKSLLVSATGLWAGIPPTLLCPVAFHGATLKKLKVKQGRSGGKNGAAVSYWIDMTGPILPHVIHMLNPVLSKTVVDFRIRATSLASTVNLNLNSRYNSSPSMQRVGTTASAFELQNLSDCGLTKGILEAFCRSDNVDTINSNVECKAGLFRWS